MEQARLTIVLGVVCVRLYRLGELLHHHSAKEKQTPGNFRFQAGKVFEFVTGLLVSYARFSTLSRTAGRCRRCLSYSGR